MSKTTTKYNIFQGMKIGFTVICVLLAAADIAMTAVTLYQYYNRDHMPVPHHIVDIHSDEKTGTEYITYKNVLTQENKAADLNGGKGKQWLVIYQTGSKEAGTPILVPDDDTGFVVKLKNSSLPGPEYSPLHLFGTPDAAQNLTFADGDKGWSYNDKNGGTYLFFVHADEIPSNADKQDEQTATAFSKGMVAYIGIGGVAVGMLLCLVLMTVQKRKRKEK